MLFVSHGAPSAALEQSAWHAALRSWGSSQKPRAAIVMSAHSAARTFVVGSNPNPATVHDYFGFPSALYAIRWPARGLPDVAREAVACLRGAGFDAMEDPLLGLDHGVWVPMRAAWPGADVPVIPMSVLVPSDPAELVRAGEALAPLRDEGIMLIGTGGLVHNLRQMKLGEPDAPVDPWASEFERWIFDRLESRSHELIVNYRAQAPAARLAAPTEEHIDPLFLLLGARQPDDDVLPIHRGFQYGNMALTTFALAPRASDTSIAR